MEDALTTSSEDTNSDLFDNNFKKLENAHLKSGYTEGLSDGQESVLQHGFNQGFAEATEQYLKTSKLRGLLSALLIYLDANKVNQADVDFMVKLKDMLECIKEKECEEAKIDRLSIVKMHNDHEKGNYEAVGDNGEKNCKCRNDSTSRKSSNCGWNCDRNKQAEIGARDQDANKTILSSSTVKKTQKVEQLKFNFDLKTLEAYLQDSSIPKTVLGQLKTCMLEKLD